MDLREIVWEGVDWIQEPVAASCEHSNYPSGCMKGGEFVDWLSDYCHVNKDSSPWNGWSVVGWGYPEQRNSLCSKSKITSLIVKWM
jgi:hypothetical protein